jgi:transposase-like protein
MVCFRRIDMPKCPHCHKNINVLLHGVNANIVVKAGLNSTLGRIGNRDALYTGFDAGEHPIIVPEVFDVMTSWYSCPHCCESIVDERQVKEKLSDEVDRAAERFLNGVENYLEEDKSK